MLCSVAVFQLRFHRRKHHHLTTPEPFVLTQIIHPLHSILIKLRPNLVGLEAHVLSCRFFPAPVSSLQARLSSGFQIFLFYPYQHTSKLFVLTEAHSLFSLSLSNYFVLTQTRSHTLIATRPDFCSTSNLRSRLLMEQAAHSEHVCICTLAAADFVRVHRSVRVFVQIISLHAGVSP